MKAKWRAGKVVDFRGGEIRRVAALPEVLDSLRVLQDRKKKHRISGYLENGAYEIIAQMVMEKLKKDRPKRALKRLLYAL